MSARATVVIGADIAIGTGVDITASRRVPIMATAITGRIAAIGVDRGFSRMARGGEPLNRHAKKKPAEMAGFFLFAKASKNYFHSRMSTKCPAIAAAAAIAGDTRCVRPLKP